ncbi:MAG TPA: Ig-like domain-containing protein [Gemmatimonadales bacterium]|jgi:hypothetical protein|nr:Ig-like domain-containing protein [Gemmatimonadales bacterium]
MSGVRFALLLVAAPLSAQGQAGQPLRATDIIRLLASGTAPLSVATRIGRDCLTFVPSTRDRRNFQALGADTAVMARIDRCVRRGVRKPSAQATAPAVPPAPIPTTPASTPVRSGSPAPAPAATAQPPVTTAPGPAASADNTGFVEGTGQRGVVGLPAANPLVFEVKDAAGKPLQGARVTFTADNAQLHTVTPATDAAGRLRVNVVFGHTAGKSVIRAAVGQIFRSTTLYPSSGSPSRLEFHVGATAIGDTLHLAPDTTATVRVVATDEFGNPVALVGLQSLSGDEGVIRVDRVGGDTVAGTLAVRARGQGNTQLAVQGSGIFSNLTVIVGH